MRSADVVNFLSKLHFTKIVNTGKILSSYYFSRLSKTPVQWGLPMHLTIEPTTSCNLRCPECPSGLRSFTRPTGMLQPETFMQAVDELKDHLIYLYLYFQGEPFLHPQFSDLIQYATGKGLYVVTSTNGHFLNEDNARAVVESGLDRLIISIDGATQETYESYRVGGSLDKVKEGTRNLIYWKKKLARKTPHVIFQFLVVKPNEHQIPDVYALAEELGIDEVKLKTAQVYDYKDGNELIPSIDKYARYKLNADGTYSIKNELLNHCWKLWHSCVITWDGKVVPCCFDKDAKYVMGDINEQSFNEIWQAKAYHNFRTSIIKARKEIDICRNCSEGTKVWTT